MHYPSEFEDVGRARRSFAFFFLLCALGLALVAAVSFYGGIYTANAMHREAERVKAQTPRRATPSTFQPLLSCSTRDVIEYQRICRARERMTKVGPT